MQEEIEEFRALLEADVIAASRRALGMHLVWGDMRAEIVETEAYREGDDPACHAWRKRSPKNESMFGPAGTSYVYFTYGNHWMLNIVAFPLDRAAAVLIRAAKPIAGFEDFKKNRPAAAREVDLLSGPGKLTQAFGITSRQDRLDLLARQNFRLEIQPPVREILVGTRIGIAAGKGDELPWRFVHAQEKAWASKPHVPNPQSPHKRSG